MENSTLREIAAELAGFFGPLLVAARRRPVSLFFKSLTEPLLDHTLVVEVAAAGYSLDSGKHPGIEAQGDGRGLFDVRLEERSIHQVGIDLMLGPVDGFVFRGLKRGDVVPLFDGIHGKLLGERIERRVREVKPERPCLACGFGVFALVEGGFLFTHISSEDHAVVFSIGPKNTKNVPPAHAAT